MTPKELLSLTHRVTIELSNLCNYATIHPKCPTSTFKDTKIFPLKVFKSVIGELREAGWGDGEIFAFHAFNEPGIDPRLMWMIEYVSEQLPGIKSLLMTNGWYLNEELAKEFHDAGLNRIIVSCYGKENLKRLRPLNQLPFVQLNRSYLLVNVLNPDGPPPPDRINPCFAPLNDLTIRASGNVGLCCQDYDETVVFGNVFKEPLMKILGREWGKMVEIQKKLKRRERSLPRCSVCYRRRRNFGRKKKDG